MEMLADDAFWAARRVAAFDDGLIRALVHTGQFSDPSAEEYLAKILMQRRDKIAKAYLPAVNPIVNPRLSADGTLTFDNAAIAEGGIDVAAGYAARWSAYEHGSGTPRELGDSRNTRPSLAAPAALPATDRAIVRVEVTADAAARPEWQRPVTLDFRRGAGGWTLVGLDRAIGTR